LKQIHAKLSIETEELQKQYFSYKTKCQQLQNERLPLIAQLDFADRNLRQCRKHQHLLNDDNQRQQQDENQHQQHKTSTMIQQPSSILHSIENRSQNQSRLIRSPSLDMRTVARTHGNSKLATMETNNPMKQWDETHSLEDEFMLAMPKSQSLNSFAAAAQQQNSARALASGNQNQRHQVESMTTKYEIENEDEPIHLDFGPIDYAKRISELQRRNLAERAFKRSI